MTALLTELWAVASGLVAGAFLFFRYYTLQTDHLWGLRWYEGALLLAGLGLAGLFPEAWLGAALSMAVAAFLGTGVETYLETYLEISRDPGCCNLWPIGLAMSLILGFPAPLIGGAIGRVLARMPVPKFVYALPLAAALGIGASLPVIQQAEYRRIETDEIPALLKRIYAAEISFRARRADQAFTCDGRQLPEVRNVRWTRSEEGTFTVVQHYTITLEECPNEASPHRFRLTAFSRGQTRTGPRFSIDETGELVISRGSAAGPASIDESGKLARSDDRKTLREPDPQMDFVQILGISPQRGVTVPRGQPCR